MNKLLILDDDASTYLAEINRRNLPRIQIVKAADIHEAKKRASFVNIIFGKPALVASIL